MSERPGARFCGFCEKSQDDVAIVIAGKTAIICSECVSVCVGVIADAASRKSRTYFVRPEDVPTSRIDEIMAMANSKKD